MMPTTLRTSLIVLVISPLLLACEPEVGSESWCADMKEKPQGDWTFNETASFTKHCLIDSMRSQ